MSDLKALLTAKKIRLGEKRIVRHDVDLQFCLIALSNNVGLSIRGPAEERRVLAIISHQDVPFDYAYPGLTKYLDNMEKNEPQRLNQAIVHWLQNVYPLEDIPKIAPQTKFRDLLVKSSTIGFSGHVEEFVQTYFDTEPKNEYSLTPDGLANFFKDKSLYKNKTKDELKSELERVQGLHQLEQDYRKRAQPCKPLVLLPAPVRSPRSPGLSPPSKRLKSGSKLGAIDEFFFPSGVHDRVVERINLDEKAMDFFMKLDIDMLHDDELASGCLYRHIIEITEDPDPTVSRALFSKYIDDARDIRSNEPSIADC